MAVGVEEAGVVFYERLAALVRDDQLKSIFLSLSKAELKHRDRFKDIADSFRHETPNEYSIDISMLMQSHVDKLKEAAFNMRPFSKNPVAVPDALNIAVHTEEEAIHIFTEMRGSFIEKFHGVLSAIIEEEKKHLEILNGVKAKTGN